MARCDYARCRRRALFTLRVDDGGRPFPVGCDLKAEHAIIACERHLRWFLGEFGRWRKIISMI